MSTDIVLSTNGWCMCPLNSFVVLNDVVLSIFKKWWVGARIVEGSGAGYFENSGIYHMVGLGLVQ